MHSKYVKILYEVSDFLKPYIAPPTPWLKIMKTNDEMLWYIDTSKVDDLTEDDVIELIHSAYNELRKDCKLNSKILISEQKCNYADVLRDFVMVDEHGKPTAMWMPYMRALEPTDTRPVLYEFDDAKLKNLSRDRVIELMRSSHTQLVQMYYDARRLSINV